MKFHTFLESLYVSSNQELQKEYKTYTHAKTLATKDLIDMQRSFFQFISKVEILFHFILVKLHIVKQPMTAQEIFNEANKVVEIKPEAPVNTPNKTEGELTLGDKVPNFHI